MPVMLEPTFLAQNEEALMTAGYIHQSRVNHYSSGGSGNRGRGMNVEPGYKKGGYMQVDSVVHNVLLTVFLVEVESVVHTILVKELAGIKELDFVKMIDPFGSSGR